MGFLYMSTSLEFNKIVKREERMGMMLMCIPISLMWLFVMSQKRMQFLASHWLATTVIDGLVHIWTEVPAEFEEWYPVVKK